MSHFHKCPWAGHFTCRSLCFHMCQMGTAVPPSSGSVRTRQDPAGRTFWELQCDTAEKRPLGAPDDLQQDLLTFTPENGFSLSTNASRLYIVAHNIG